MPKKSGSKFRTLNKFGKSRRKKVTAAVSEKEPVADDSWSVNNLDHDTLPSTSSTAHPSDSGCNQLNVASSRKIGYFKSQKRKHESSDESDNEKDDETPADDHVPDDSKNLTVIEGGPELRMGSSCLLELKCTRCGKLSSEYTSPKTGIIHTGFDVNRRLVAAATSTGMGFAQVQRFFAMMGLPKPMNEKTWYDYKKRLHGRVKQAACRHLEDAAETVRSAYADMNRGIPDVNGILDISISIDGSWHKRGRTSHNGVCVIEIITGLIVDFVALSNYCQVCAGDSSPSPGDAGFDNWYASHQDKCQKNINCSSPAMEMEGAVILFSRSEEKGFRYTQMLGDGDAKTHAKLLEEDVYDGRPIEQIECVNHVTKRLGTALRTLVEKQKAQGQPIGGKGKLTAERIKKLTNYYGRAIKDHKGDLDAMVNAVWASFFHTLSSDASHNHDFCPAGPRSWCFFQRARANNTEPRPHTKELPAFVGEALKPVYQRLGDPQLLRRCLDGKTQNSNEACIC